VGDRLTFVDIRFYMTLIRFDPVYVVHFKTNKKMIKDYKNLSRYTKHLHHNLGLKKFTDMDHIKNHYYKSHESLNPGFRVPTGPEPWWEELPENEEDGEGKT